MNRDSNAYTFLFATVMVLIVASALAFTATALKDLQASNVRKEKMQNILATIGIKTDREMAETLYNKFIVEELSLVTGGSVDSDTDAFELELTLSESEKEKPKGFFYPSFNLYAIGLFRLVLAEVVSISATSI